MRSDECLARLRLNTGIEDSAIDYPDAVMLNELNDAGMSTFEAMIVKAKAGFWVDTLDFTVTTPQPKYRIPARACGQVLVKCEVTIPGNAMSLLPEVSESHASLYTTPPSQVGPPRMFVIRGDQVVLMPNPDSTYTLRMYFWRRPSRLVTQQSSTLNGGTVRGLITAVNTTTRQVTVNALPFDMEAVAGGIVTPAVITTANQVLDVVHPNGWHECAVINAPQTIAGLIITLGGTDDLSEIAVGDYVRVAEQTDWPMLPDDFHRALVDVTSVKILAQRKDHDKAADFAESVSADIARFLDLMQPRVRESALTIKAPLPQIRGRPRWNWPGFP